MASDFTDLETWKLAHELMLDVYQFVKLLPPSEKFKRVDQLERSSSSIPANIAEGYGRYYYLENISFCRKARGSLTETKDHIIAAKDLNQAPVDTCQTLISKCDTLRKILNGYIRYLKKQKVEDDE